MRRVWARAAARRGRRRSRHWFAFVRSLRGSGRGIHPTGARAGSVGVSAVRRIL